jgi:hypothetical protein
MHAGLSALRSASDIVESAAACIAHTVHAMVAGVVLLVAEHL